MTPILALVIVRYNSTDPAARRLHVREAMATCRWAVAQGYAPVCSLLHLADANDPPEDTAGEVRERVMEYSTTLARMVGADGGILIMPGWYQQTQGMEADCEAFRAACQGAEYGRWGLVKMIKFAEIEPYLPRDLVAQVQAAVDEMRDKADNAFLGSPQEIAAIGIRGSIGCIEAHTGITPTEVTP